MKRFRFTVLAICLVLLYLGGTDAYLFLRNQEPAVVSIAQLEQSAPPREWLQIDGGYLDLEQAISTSGSLELEALLVPLSSHPSGNPFRILVETRDPALLSLFQTYHLTLETAAEQQAYLKAHAAEFHPRRDLSGMVVTGLIATGNRDKLLTLAQELGQDLPADVIFVSEDKTPDYLRALFFLAIGLIGLFKVMSLWRQPDRPD